MRAMYTVDSDIAAASTLESAFYRDAAAFERSRERVFARTWQWLGTLEDVAAPGSLTPRNLLPGHLDEPLLLARDTGGTLRCLSNVCTHRGNILVREPCRAEQIRCGYHSRRFDLAGRMVFMPEFIGVKDFPAESDHLARVPFADWHGHGFASIDPAAPFEEFLRDLDARLGWLPIERFAAHPERSRDFEIHAHWALYVENYLEGFHIPFVHAGLSQIVDYGSYSSELFPHSSLQVALAKEGETAFDDGKNVAAYYFWIFPNLMLNFYPWGLSLNLVQPLAIDRTRVSFRSFVWDASRLERGAGSSLDRVEAEDEAIVEAVQRGVRSRFYRRGRYSPTRERGVHHFHRLLCHFLNSGTYPELPNGR
ncbi:MAG: SRPBCC family protein [Bacillota bacterium]